MKIFISWAGKQSKALAEAFRDFLPNVIQSAEPFVSSHDIDAGARWLQTLNEKLDDTNIGILCLTKESLNSKWLHYEAGALGKVLKDTTLVCTCLYELESTDVEYPLAQFQHNAANKEGVQRIVETINKRLGDNALESYRLQNTFEKFWDDMEHAITALAELTDATDATAEQRSDRDLLEEILQLVRDKGSAETSLAHMWSVKCKPAIEQTKRELEVAYAERSRLKAERDSLLTAIATATSGTCRKEPQELQALEADLNMIEAQLNEKEARLTRLMEQKAFLEL